MHKLSQLKLLEQGFLNKIRTAGRAMKAVGKGIYALDPEGFNTLTAPLKTISSPVTGIAKGLYELRPNASPITDPKKFVLQELKISYYKTFNPNSIKVLEVKKDTTASQNVQYLPKVNTNTNRFIVSFKAERFKPSGGSSPSEIYYAYVFRGGKENELSMDVRDAKGNQVQGEKSKKNKKSETPTFESIIKKYQAKGTAITVALLSTIITKNLGISEQQYANKLSPGATDMDGVIMDITNKTAVQDVLDVDDIKSVYQVLQTRGLTEKVKVSQKVLLEQLTKLL
jgi:hypothetical protein